MSALRDVVDISIFSFVHSLQNGVTPYNLARIHGQEDVSALLQNYYNVKEDKEITKVWWGERDSFAYTMIVCVGSYHHMSDIKCKTVVEPQLGHVGTTCTFKVNLIQIP